MSRESIDWKNFQKKKESAKRRVGGWRAKKVGESAEETIIQVGKTYLSQNLAEVRKRPEPYRRIGAAKSNGQFTAAPLCKSGPDLDLALPDGRCGLLEIKSRKGHRMPLSAVGQVQNDALKRRIEWNGFGIILVMLWKEGVTPKWWAIDWRRWNQAKVHGYKSLSIDDLDQVAIRCEMLTGHTPHWLPAVLQAHQEATETLWPLHEVET